LGRKSVLLLCHVCGRNFTASRFDARTCTSTCRQRLRRGQEFAYLAGLTKRQQHAGRKMHAVYDELKAARKDHVAARRKAREAKREAVRQQERERTIAELASKITALANFAALLRGREQFKKLREEQEQQRQRMRDLVAGVLKLFDQQWRNDRSAEAIAAFLDMPEYFPVEVVRELLAELHN
jgi:hypothetical protein